MENFMLCAVSGSMPVSSCEYCENFKNTFLEEYQRTAAFWGSESTSKVYGTKTVTPGVLKCITLNILSFRAKIINNEMSHEFRIGTLCSFCKILIMLNGLRWYSDIFIYIYLIYSDLSCIYVKTRYGFC